MSRRAATTIVAMLIAMLAGCLEFVPIRVTQLLVVESDGSFVATYAGTFQDLHSIAEAIDADKGRKPRTSVRPGEQTPSQQIRERYRQRASFESVRQVRPHVFELRLRTAGHLLQSRDWTDPGSLLYAYGTSEEVPRLVGAARAAGDNETIMLVDLVQGDRQRQEISGMEEAGGPHFRRTLGRLLNQMDATVSVEIPDRLVERHNATSVKDLGNGRSLYSWKVHPRKAVPVVFVAYFGDRTSPAYKISRSAPGTRCKDLIGDDCKCGPFVLKMPFGEKAPGRVAYELAVQDRVLQGCSSDDGEIQAVPVETTGGLCRLTVLPEEVSARDCRK